MIKPGSVSSRIADLLLAPIVLLGSASVTYGLVDTYTFNSREQEQRFFQLTSELRCPKCQNQSIADSNAPIAQDLRREVHRLLTEEQASDQQVIDFMLVRYGDFVLYKPRLTGMNWVLWLGPLLLLLAGLLVMVRVVRVHRPASQKSGQEQKEEKEGRSS